MIDMKPKITPPVQRLLDMDCEVVYAKDIAPIVKMKPDVIIKRVKEGVWDQERLGNYVTSGDHVKFFRLDFLQKCGFIEKKKEKTPEVLLLERIVQLLTDQNWMLLELLNGKRGESA